MRVLFLDDDERRCEAARKMYSQDELNIVHSAVEAINQLGFQAFDLVSLGHDLGGEVYVNSTREDCGMEVVRWVARNLPDVSVFAVHSWNIPAATEMARKLQDAGYAVLKIPFGTSKLWLAEPHD